MQEGTQLGRANPTRATAEGRQSWGGQDGRRWEGIFRVPPALEAPPPKKRSGPSQGTPEGRKHLFFPHPPRQWEEPPERPRGEDPPGKGRSKGGQNRQGKQQAQGQMTGGSCKGHTENSGGTSPTFPWMQDTPERLRLRLRWTPRPVPELSKPFFHPAARCEKKSGGPGCLPPCLQPGLLGVHLGSGHQAKGWRSWTGHAGRRALLYDVLHGHGGQGRLCGGRPQLQNVEHSQMVPQTGRPAAGEGRSRPCGAWRTWSPA